MEKANLLVIIHFDLKLFTLRFIIKLERNHSKKSGGPVVGLRILNAKVPGSSPGVCSFSSLQIIGLRSTLWHREILALHLVYKLQLEGI